MAKQIYIAYAKGWQGLYVDGRLMVEAQQLTIARVMDYVLFNHVDRFEEIAASDVYIAMAGSFPPLLSDVVLQDGRTMREYWNRK
jgi:hypothetical protein